MRAHDSQSNLGVGIAEDRDKNLAVRGLTWPAIDWRWQDVMERVMGIEPTYSAWKAAALPLSYTRVSSARARPL